MGQLIPDDFDLAGLEHSEQRVVGALVEGTDSSWLVMPHVTFRDRGTDGEADIVVLHPEHGGLVIEVKGGTISIDQGAWVQDGRRLGKSPVEQALHGKHALVRRLKAVLGSLTPPYFHHAVAFPDAQSVPNTNLGPDLEPQMVLTKSELAWPDKALVSAMDTRPPVPPEVLDRTVRALRPDVVFSGGIGTQLSALSRRLDEQTATVLRTAEGLDAATRVKVTGAAGTGKTGLAVRWARRAEARGERVLLVCFNVPMAAHFSALFEGSTSVMAGTFHSVAQRLLAPAGVAWPDHPDGTFWDETVSDLLFTHRGAFGRGFDTIIIDEVQDFQPLWLLAVENLLDPDGAGRIMRLGDAAQNVYRVEDEADDGWVVLPLSTNCRNTRAIARVAERLGGAPALPTSPDGPEVSLIRVGGEKELIRKVGQQLHLLVSTHRLPPSSIAVITTRTQLRDTLLEAGIKSANLARWDHRDERVVVCETGHRLKGTEWEAVIVANLEPTEKASVPGVLYVAVSRARTWLSVVAPDDTCALLGGAPSTAS